MRKWSDKAAQLQLMGFGFASHDHERDAADIDAQECCLDWSAVRFLSESFSFAVQESSTSWSAPVAGTAAYIPVFRDPLQLRFLKD